MLTEKKLPPGNLGFPFLGEAIEQFSTHHLFYWKRFQTYGYVYKTQFVGIKTICLIGPEANQFVLQSKANHFSQQGWKFLMPLVGEDGLTLLDGEKHRLIKDLMYPAFHGESLNSYLDIINNTTKSFLSQLDCSEKIPLLESSRNLILMISCYLLLGQKTSSVKINQLSEYFYDLVDGIETVMRIDIPLTKFGRGRIARKKIEKLFSKIVEINQDILNSKPTTILDFLCKGTNEKGTKLNKDQIVRQMLQLLYSGYETTSKLITWCIFELYRNKKWLEILKKEQSEKIKSNKLNINSLKELENLTFFIKETARLYSPAYMFPREVKETLEYKGYLIPKGWLVLVSPLITHRLPELYTNPNHFDPLRFCSPRKEDKKHPFAFIPFGGGVHRCIGEELAMLQAKIILLELLRNYEWEINPITYNTIPISDIYNLERSIKIKLKLTR
ncbi:MAG: cytochrome P450 [Prochloraceae cyanobacterium]